MTRKTEPKGQTLKDRKGGRPTRLTVDTHNTIVTAIRAGNYYQAAVSAAGIHYTTFLKWMRRGQEESNSIYGKFFNDVTRAEAEAEVRMVAQWQGQIPQDWRAARDFLARRHPERWGPKSYLDAAVSGEMKHEHTHAIDQAIIQIAAKKGIDIGGVDISASRLDHLADAEEAEA